MIQFARVVTVWSIQLLELDRDPYADLIPPDRVVVELIEFRVGLDLYVDLLPS